MLKIVGLALVLAMGSTSAIAKDDDDDKVPAADLAKVTAALTDLGCKDPEASRRRKRASTRLTTPSARWVRWTSSSTKISLSS
jgi:hypothetical protein